MAKRAGEPDNASDDTPQQQPAAGQSSNTPAGAHASAVVYSLIETARANGRDPYAWLLYVLERLPRARGIDDIEALLPWNVSDGLRH